MRTRYLVILAVLPIFITILLSFVKRETIKNRLPEILAGQSIFIAILLVIHKHLTNGMWFQWDEFWHHEAIETCFVSIAIGLLLGKYLGRR